MIIFLGRRLPCASSDLPGGRNGPGRSVCSQAAKRHGEPLRLADRLCTAPLFGLAPDGVYRARPVTRPAGELLPHRFTLTPAEAQAPWPRRSIFCGTVPIRSCFKQPRTVGVTHHRALWSPDFPPWHVLRCEQLGGVSRPWSTNRSAPAIITPATDLIYTVRCGGYNSQSILLVTWWPMTKAAIPILPA